MLRSGGWCPLPSAGPRRASLMTQPVPLCQRADECSGCSCRGADARGLGERGRRPRRRRRRLPSALRVSPSSSHRIGATVRTRQGTHGRLMPGVSLRQMGAAEAAPGRVELADVRATRTSLSSWTPATTSPASPTSWPTSPSNRRPAPLGPRHAPGRRPAPLHPTRRTAPQVRRRPHLLQGRSTGWEGRSGGFHSWAVSVGMPSRIRPVVSHIAGLTWMLAVMAFASRNRRWSGWSS